MSPFRIFWLIAADIALQLSGWSAANADDKMERLPSLATSASGTQVQVTETYGRLPLYFEANRGQTDPQVKFISRGDRYVLCAIDALGVAPMLGESVRIRSRCHHCGEPLEFSVDPSGPGPGAEGIMMWAGKRCAGERRASTST